MRFPLALLASVLMMSVAACSSTPTSALPSAADLLNRSSAAMKTVQTAAFDLQTDKVTILPIRSAQGTVTAKGEVQGTAALGIGGQTAEVGFTVVGGSLYLKGPTGGYRKLPVFALATVYDPTTILSPDKGLAAALATAAASPDATTEAAENVNGTDTYRVAATLDLTKIPALAPGVGTSTRTTWWIATGEPRLVQARVEVPAGGTVTVTFSDLDAPVTITPPT